MAVAAIAAIVDSICFVALLLLLLAKEKSTTPLMPKRNNVSVISTLLNE
jgi:hypothetical protein